MASWGSEESEGWQSFSAWNMRVVGASFRTDIAVSMSDPETAGNSST